MNLKLTAITILISITSFAQSKKELKRQIAQLTSEKATVMQQAEADKKEKESLKKRLDKISNIEIDEVITPDEQPRNIVIGEEGWRVDLNGTKYKSDILGQLGTIWILDSSNQLKPQGAILLSDYNIDPSIISQDNDILYKKFIAKGTTLQGDGGAPFAKIMASLKADQFSDFSITIDGTSLIKPKFPDLRKIALEVKDIFDIPNSKGVFLCTGMHVIRYASRVFSKSEGDGKITSPVVNIGGSFYAENNEESKEYFVARQLTQIFEGTNKDSLKLNKDIQTLLVTQPASSIQSISKIYSPDEILTFFLKRQPSSNEILEYQSSPEEFIKKHVELNNVSDKEKILLKVANRKVAEVPKKLKSIE